MPDSRYLARVIRNIIFDWSGTLVDDLPAVLQASNHVFRQAGVRVLTMDEFRAEFTLPFTGFYARHVPQVPLAQLETWFHAEFARAQHLVAPLPHADAFLKFCRQRSLRTFVLSSVHRLAFAAQAARTGFGAYLDHHYLEVRDKRSRIHELIATHCLTPAETLFVGDMQHDIETARHGGVRSCAVLTGYNRLTQLREAAPDLIVEHLGELREILERNAMNLAPREGASPPDDPAAPVPMPIATVGALIYNDAGQVLLVRTQKWSGLWGIPGGKIKCGEASEAALRRELREETGLAVEDIRFVLAQDCIHSGEFYREAHFILLNYTCRAPGNPNVTLNEEAQEFRWLSPAAAAREQLNTPTRVLLEAVTRLAPSPCSMDTILIQDLEVSYHVGVGEVERSQPQRLLLSIAIEHDFTTAAAGDDLTRTIDYFAVSRRLLGFGEGRRWKLIETLAVDVAALVRAEFGAQRVTVEVKKFILPETRCVAVRVTRP